eukprot:gene20342-24941_t
MPTVVGATSSNPEAYTYLAESIKAWPDQIELSRWIRGAGFTRVAYRNLTAGVVAMHRGRKPVDPEVLASVTKRKASLTKRKAATNGAIGPRVNPSVSSAQPPNTLSASLGLGERLFASSGEKKFVADIEEALAKVEAGLFGEITFADDLADVTSRYLLDAGGKR